MRARASFVSPICAPFCAMLSLVKLCHSHAQIFSILFAPAQTRVSSSARAGVQIALLLLSTAKSYQEKRAERLRARALARSRFRFRFGILVDVDAIKAARIPGGSQSASRRRHLKKSSAARPHPLAIVMKAGESRGARKQPTCRESEDYSRCSFAHFNGHNRRRARMPASSALRRRAAIAMCAAV